MREYISFQHIITTGIVITDNNVRRTFIVSIIKKIATTSITLMQKLYFCKYKIFLSIKCMIISLNENKNVLVYNIRKVIIWIQIISVIGIL